MRNSARPRELFANHVWLPGGWARDVRLTLDAHGFIERIDCGAEAGDAERLGGWVLPGMVNVHSHAFQRLIAGLTDTVEHPDDSFWSWREAMYRTALQLDADAFESVCRCVFAQMLAAGYTSVGEFHYVHHQPDGTPYDRRAELAERVVAAAAHAGIGLTLMPVLYAHGGFGGQPASAGQRRFINDTDNYLALLDQARACTADRACTNTGAAMHSLRAVTGEQIDAVVDALPGDMPLHIHVAEQHKEVEDSLAWSGRRPIEWLLEHAPVDRRWCLIHATHANKEEIEALAQREPVVGLCPTTEANLGDGLFAAEAFAGHGGGLAIGSDSHVSLGVAEELRWLEYGQRLRSGRRNRLADSTHPAVGDWLYARTAENGARALGQPVGRIAEGLRADLVVLEDSDPMLAGCPARHRLNRWLFAAGERAIREVRVAGEPVVTDGRHRDDDRLQREFSRLVREQVHG